MTQKVIADTKPSILCSVSGVGIVDWLKFNLILCFVLGLLFLRSFAPAWVVFANDGPLGGMMAERSQVPETFTGSWADLNGYGSRDPGALPNLTSGLLYLLGPLGFSKYY